MESRNIVCGIDDGYCQHCAAMLVSLFSNNKARFVVYILSLDIKEDRKRALKKLISSYGNEVHFIDISLQLIESFPIKQTDYLSLATYLRLFIPQLLPEELKKVLYIDSDIIFNGDISELYDMNIDQYSLAAMEDALIGNAVRLGYDEKDSYFNAGLLLLNVSYLRRINFTSKALDYITNNYQKIRLHDQDVLNALLHGTTLFVSIKWNMLDCFFKKRVVIAEKYTKELAFYQKFPIVIHFSGPLKPWHHGCSHPLKGEYFRYLKLISWAKRKCSYGYVFKKFKFPVNFFIFCGFTLEQAEYMYKKIKI